MDSGEPLVLKMAGNRSESVALNLVPKTAVAENGVKEFACTWHPSRKAMVAWVRMETGAQMPWGCPERDEAYWGGLEHALETELKRYCGLALSQDETALLDLATDKPNVTVGKGPIPLSVRVTSNSEAVKAGGTITSVLYTLAPNEVTAAAAVVGETAVVIDGMGGSRGLSLYAVPSGQVVIVPNDPVAFAKNLGRAAIDPRDGAKVAMQVTSSFVTTPGGTFVAILPREFQEKLPPVFRDPGGALEKTLKDPLRHLNPLNW